MVKSDKILCFMLEVSHTLNCRKLLRGRDTRLGRADPGPLRSGGSASFRTVQLVATAKRLEISTRNLVYEPEMVLSLTSLSHYFLRILV